MLHHVQSVIHQSKIHFSFTHNGSVVTPYPVLQKGAYANVLSVCVCAACLPPATCLTPAGTCHGVSFRYGQPSPAFAQTVRSGLRTQGLAGCAANVACTPCHGPLSCNARSRPFLRRPAVPTAIVLCTSSRPQKPWLCRRSTVFLVASCSSSQPQPLQLR